MGIFNDKPNIPKENMFNEDMDKISLKITGFTNKNQSPEDKIYGNIRTGGGFNMDFGGTNTEKMLNTNKKSNFNIDKFLPSGKNKNMVNKNLNTNRFFSTKKTSVPSMDMFFNSKTTQKTNNNFLNPNKYFNVGNKDKHLEKFMNVSKLEKDVKVKNRKLTSLIGNTQPTSNLGDFSNKINGMFGMNNVNNTSDKLNQMLGTGDMGGKINNILQINKTNNFNTMSGMVDVGGKINNMLGNGINIDRFSRNNIDSDIRKEEIKQKIRKGAKAVGSGIAKGAKVVGGGVASGAKVVGSGVASGAKVVGSGVAKGFSNVGKSIKQIREESLVEEGLRNANINRLNRRFQENTLKKIQKGGELTEGELASAGLTFRGGKFVPIVDVEKKNYYRNIVSDVFGDVSTQRANDLTRLIYDNRSDFITRPGGIKKVPIMDKKGNIKMVAIPGSEKEWNPAESFARKADILMPGGGSFRSLDIMSGSGRVMSDELIGMRQMTPSMTGSKYSESVMGLLPMSKQIAMRQSMVPQMPQVPQMPVQQIMQQPVQQMEQDIPKVETQVAPPGQKIVSPFSGRPVTYTRGPYKKKGIYRLQETVYHSPTETVVVPNPNYGQPLPQSPQPQMEQPIVQRMEQQMAQESDPFNMLQSVDDTSDKEKARALIGF